jgi:ubiquitin-protein ligase
MADSVVHATSGCTTATLTGVSDAAAGRMKRLRVEWQAIQLGRTSGTRVPNSDVTPGLWDGAVGGWSAAPRVNEAGEEDIMNWSVKIYGPAGTPYQGGTFCCNFKFPERYPFQAPTVRFKTVIFHPNSSFAVGERVYLPVLEHCWSPQICVPLIILAIIDMLRKPSAEDFGGDTARLFHSDPAAFAQQARESTLQHAFGAHNRTASLLFDAAAACSMFCSQKLQRGVQIMRGHALSRPTLELAVALLRKQRALLLRRGCLMSTLAIRLVLAVDKRQCRLALCAVAQILRRCFGRLGWQLWVMF